MACLQDRDSKHISFQDPDSFVSAMTSSKMSKGGSICVADRYDRKEVGKAYCDEAGNVLFRGDGFHMLGPGASEKIHQAISNHDMSKLKMTICGGMATITVRLETITPLGSIFIRDTCPNLRYLIKKMDGGEDQDEGNGKADATLKKRAPTPRQVSRQVSRQAL